MSGVYEIIRSSLMTRSRLAGVAALGLGTVLIASLSDTFADTLNVVPMLVVSMYVAVTSSYFGTSAFGDSVEDETLVYLWASPIPRWRIALVGTAAALGAAIPAAAIVAAGAMGAAESDRTLLGGLIAAAVLASFAYTSLSVALGLSMRRALTTSLFYVILWENFVANNAEGAARLSIKHYSLSLMRVVGEIPAEPNDVSAVTSIVVLMGLAAAGVAVATWRLRTREIP